MGSMSFAVPILEGLNEKYEVCLVVTQPDKPVGRKKIITSTPVKEKAIELGLPVFQPENIKTDYQKITNQNLDFIIVAAYGQMIPEQVISHARYQAINVHASLLPKYRGGSPMHRAIQYGDNETGITVMYMAMKMDSGDILAQESIPITKDDNVGTLEEKLGLVGKNLLLDVLEDIDDIIPVRQDESKITFARNIKAQEERIDFSLTAEAIRNHVRGFYPWPLTYFMIDNLKVKVFEVEIVDGNETKHPGEIIDINKRGVIVQTGKRAILLLDLQLQGKNRMKINDFMNGIGKTLFAIGKMLD